MTPDQDLIKQVRAALATEPRARATQFPLQIEWQDGKLLLEGEAASVQARKVSLRLARKLAGPAEVDDRLGVQPGEARTDGEILDAFGKRLLAQSELSTCTFRYRNKGRTEVLHEYGGEYPSGDLEISVNEGFITASGAVLSLSHMRLVEVLAWWTPGCRGVENRLDIVPPEEDDDNEISDAVRLVLESDPLVQAGTIVASTVDGAVTLTGTARNAEEAERAEFDTWCIPGVEDVINQLVVASN